MALPMDTVDFLGIGAQKAGTTWLFRQLSRHPQVAFPRGKETHYWDRHASPRADEWVRLLQPATRRTADGRPVRTGEITPAYALLPEASIRAIGDRCPDLRLFMILRNPIERAWSAAVMELVRAGKRVDETSDAWFLEHFEAPESSARGDYATDIERWRSVFPGDYLLVLFHEDLAARPREVLASLGTHLDIDAADLAALPDATLREVVTPSLFANGDDPPSPPPLRASLFERSLEIHGDGIARVERLLGRDLGAWRAPPRDPAPAGPRIAVPLRGARPAHAADRSATRHGLVGPADLWEMKRKFQIDFLRRAGLRPGHRLLDLGCGTLRGGIPLIEHLEPGGYVGVEIRAEVLEEGRRELEERGLADRRPRLVHCPDLATLELGCEFDFAWAFSVLIHMDDRTLDRAIAAVARHLRPGGVFYANVHLGTVPDGSWREFPLVRRERAFYQAAFARHGLTIEDVGSLPELGHHHPRLTPEHQESQRMLKATRAGQVHDLSDGDIGDRRAGEAR